MRRRLAPVVLPAVALPGDSVTAGSYQEARTSGSPDVCPPLPSGGSTNSLSPPLVLRDMAP